VLLWTDWTMGIALHRLVYAIDFCCSVLNLYYHKVFPVTAVKIGTHLPNCVLLHSRRRKPWWRSVCVWYKLPVEVIVIHRCAQKWIPLTAYFKVTFISMWCFYKWNIWIDRCIFFLILQFIHKMRKRNDLLENLQIFRLQLLCAFHLWSWNLYT